jgi:hypothetical protein
MGKKSHTQEPVTRRNLLRKGAAGALGAAAATAITATPASAADGDPIILGQENVAFSTTRIHDDFAQNEVDILGSGGVLTAAAGFGPGPAISALALGGTAISADGKQNGLTAYGQTGVGVSAHSPFGIGVNGSTIGGTGIKAEASPPAENGTAFEAVGPVKFSTSGLADVAASTDRVTVNPEVAITAQSKVLAMLQGNSGNKAMVEHVEVNPVAVTFQVVLTKIPARPVQLAWFLMS